MNLIRLADLSPAVVHHIWGLVGQPAEPMAGTVAWSFEGNGIRTRTTFIQAFRDLGLAFTELPNLLKTGERACDLAGYLDPFYAMYVVRESNHARLAEFAAASRRPVINAMSSDGHPCEVLTDAYYVETELRPLAGARVCLWGPPTNVLRSWHELAAVLGLQLTHACDAAFHQATPGVQFTEACPTGIDIVITDGWPSGVEAPTWSLTEAHLARMGQPKLLPMVTATGGSSTSCEPRFSRTHWAHGP